MEGNEEGNKHQPIESAEAAEEASGFRASPRRMLSQESEGDENR